DMDFKPPQKVLDVLSERIQHGIFGYTSPTTDTYKSVCKWLHKRHGFSVDASSIIYSPGIVFAISMAVQAFTNEGEQIVIQPPVYTPFFNMIQQNNRKLVESPLILENGQYKMDFADLEEKFAQGAKMMILCSPHNPAGRVWTKQELQKVADLCVQYNVILLSDEIHSDLVYKPNKHIPIASLSEETANLTITCVAPSKTFNLAGLQASVIVIPNKSLRLKYQETQRRQGAGGLNTFGIIALQAAYNYGEEWLEELLPYLKENINTVHEFIQKEIPDIELIYPEGTYLAWIDCRETGFSDEELKERLLHKGHLALEAGPKYGTQGEGFVRVNLGCSKETVLEGLKRLKIALSK
ncbi:pyridoxal phosphate-dependent aminotransferase, partial [Strepomyces sp. STD 3.1]|nr:pyridoxal phosphate-dependent aminotransferase [Streptomyces sp. STD 3.1]